MKKKYVQLCFALMVSSMSIVFGATNCWAQKYYSYRIVSTGHTAAWDIEWAPEGKLWVTDRSGLVSIVDPTTGEKTQILDVSDSVFNFAEIGLLGLALHPNFVDTPYVYIVGTYRTPASESEVFDFRITRYEFSNNTLTNPVIIHSQIQFGSFHAGGRIIITQDRKLLVSRGDCTNPNAPQDTTSLWGKVLRFNLDGTIPDNNPFAGNAIWAYGFRNPQGLFQDPDGTVYTAEHGPDTDDEINIIEKGRNYGWPLVAGYCDTDLKKPFCDSLHIKDAYFSSIGTTYGMCAVGTYHGSQFPEFDNKVIATSLKSARLHVLARDISAPLHPQEVQILGYTIGRIGDVCTTPDGRIFLCSRNKDGKAHPGYPLPEGDIIVELLPHTTKENVRLNPQEKVDTIFLKAGESMLYPVKIKNSTQAVVPITNWWTYSELPNEIVPWVFAGNPWLPYTHDFQFVVRLEPKKEPFSDLMLMVYSDSTKETIRYTVVARTSFPVVKFQEDTLKTNGVPGTTTKYPVKVVNSGNAPLTILGVKYKGDASGEYVEKIFDVPVVCAVGDSVVVEVEFRPTDEYVNREAEMQLIVAEQTQENKLVLLAASHSASIESESTVSVQMKLNLLSENTSTQKLIKVTSEIFGNYTLRCISTDGSEVFRFRFTHLESEQVVSMNMQEQPSGPYVVSIEGTNARASVRLIHTK